jgi:hypothetical protein
MQNSTSDLFNQNPFSAASINFVFHLRANIFLKCLFLFKTKINLNIIERLNLNRAVTHLFSVLKTNQFMMYSEIIALCSNNHTIHANALVLRM